MSAEAVSFAALIATWPLCWSITAILAFAGWRGEPIRFLGFVTVLFFVLSLLFTAYLWAIVNAGAGYAIGVDVMRVILRLSFLAVPGVMVWFMYLFLTNKFRDPASSVCVCPQCAFHRTGAS